MAADAEGDTGPQGTLLLLGIGYFALGSISIAISRFDGGISSIWLPNAFAIFFVLSRRIALPAAMAAVAAASVGINLAAGMSAAGIALASMLNLFEVGAAVLLTTRWLGAGIRRPDSPEHAIAFFLVAAVAAPLMAASIAGPMMFLAASWPLATTIYQWFGASLLGAALVLPPMLFATTGDVQTIGSRRRLLIFAASSAGGIIVACVALGSQVFPFFSIALYLLATTVFLTRFEVSLVATVAGAVVIVMALGGLIPGFGSGAAPFADRFHVSLAIALVFPEFVSILLWRIHSDRKRLMESEDLFRRAMEDSAIGMAIVDLNGRVTKANQMLAEMMGYAADELEGMTLFDLTWPEDRHIGLKELKEGTTGRKPRYRFEKRYRRKNGTPVWVQVTGSAICDTETGAPCYMVSQIENITERVNAQQAVVEAENRWNFALSSARQGVWDMDLRKGRTYYSPIWKGMLGYADDELGDDPELWLTLIHPDDHKKALALETAHLNGETQHFEAEFRMRHKDGHWIWVLDRGKTIERDENGQTIRAIGTHTDITAQKQAQARLAETAAALRAEKERLRVTLHSIGDAVICTDAAESVTFMNAAGEALTGRTADEAVGQPLESVYCPRDEDTNAVISAMEEVADGSARTHNRAVIERPDGTRSSIRQVVSPIVTDGEVMNGSIIVFQDITDARTLQRQLAYAASHDSLTGLANRASFLATMRELVDEARVGDGARHQLLFIDLDRFKAVNDSAGHGAGDALLKQIAAALRGAVRSSDFVARLGGDEFAVILRHRDLEDAVDDAESVIAAISEIRFRWESAIYRVGASIGIASITPDSNAVDEIIAEADRGCYAAKSAGRGTVAVNAGKAA